MLGQGLAILTKGNNFCDFLFEILDEELVQTKDLLLENKCSLKEQIFPVRAETN